MTRARIRRLALALACAAAAACSGPSQLLSTVPLDGQGLAAAPLPANTRLIVRIDPDSKISSDSTLSNYATPFIYDGGPLMTLQLENRDGAYFTRAINGVYSQQVREMMENGLRAIQSRGNADAFLLQFNNVGKAGRASLETERLPTGQAVAITPALRRCTATTCAMWLFRGTDLREGVSYSSSAAPAEAPAEATADPLAPAAPAEGAPARPTENYGLTDGGHATSAEGVVRLWDRALARNAFRPGQSSNAVILYRPPGVPTR